MNKRSLVALLVLFSAVGCSTYSGIGLQKGAILFVSDLVVEGDEVVVRKEHPEAPVRFTDQDGAELKANRLRLGDKILVSDPHFGQTFTVTAISPQKVTFRLGEAWAYPTGERGSNETIVEVAPYRNILVHGR